MGVSSSPGQTDGSTPASLQDPSWASPFLSIRGEEGKMVPPLFKNRLRSLIPRMSRLVTWVARTKHYQQTKTCAKWYCPPCTSCLIWSSCIDLFCLKSMTRDKACTHRNYCIFTVLLSPSLNIHIHPWCKATKHVFVTDLPDYLDYWEIAGEAEGTTFMGLKGISIVFPWAFFFLSGKTSFLLKV